MNSWYTSIRCKTYYIFIVIIWLKSLENKRRLKWFFFQDHNKQAHLNHERTNKSPSITLYLGTIHILRKHIFGIFGPPSPLSCKHVFTTKNKQNLAFSLKKTILRPSVSFCLTWFISKYLIPKFGLTWLHPTQSRGVFWILILWVLSVNNIFI